jgi:acyl-CoA hydrolase/GNAT superfamily N-acetyltransferase
MFFDVQWRSLYKERLTSASAALRNVMEDGIRIYIASACGEPQHIVRELLEILPQYHDLEIIQNLSLGALPENWAAFGQSCRLRTFFIGPKTRKAVNQGDADYIPTYFSSIPRLFEEDGLLGIDVCLIQVSPPDEHGFCSLGIAVDTTKAAAKDAKAIIAQVNPQMPRTMGDSFLHVSQIQSFVEYEEPLLELVFRERSAMADRIARYVSQLVEDGSTIQAGIGRITNAVMRRLEDKKDLGIHTEMITDAHLHLVEKGMITGSRKSLHRGKIITSLCVGSRRLYDFVHDNPQVELYPTEYVTDSRIISQNERMVAINSALEVDLTGQVCADSIGYKVYSGIGGYVDFMRGAASAPNGKSIIVLPSTSPDGKKSRIVSHLTDGAGVVTPRSNVQYVVTEFGIAFLHGKTIRERALALINITHPKFRERLLAEAKQLRYVYQDQILPPIYEPLYPGQWETHQTFRDNLKVSFRPIKPTDERGVQEFFYSLPDQDIYYRFLSAMKVFPHRDTQAMCNIDYEHEMAIVAVTGEIGKETIVGLGRYILDQKTNMAEVDFAVRDTHQRKGIGGFLLKVLCEIGKSKGITGFTAYVLASNRSMLSVFYKVGYQVHSHFEDGIYEISFRFDTPAKPGETE